MSDVAFRQSGTSQAATPRWLHYCAVATACAALPLLLLGAEVTTKKVGMVDRKGFQPPWHLLVVLSEKAQRGEPIDPGFVIEHSHRLAGFLVGTLAIVLALGLWLTERRPWLRRLGIVALAGVVAQGLLGIFRVNLNAVMGRELAMVHGCFAQLVFSLLVSLVLFTSRGWSTQLEPCRALNADAARVRRWGLATTCLIYLQIVLGAIVRHRDVPYGARLHLLTAFGVVAASVWLIKLALDLRPRLREIVIPATGLAILICVQLVLGVESWMSRFPSPMWNQAQPLPVHPELFRSLHYFVGALLFANALVVTLQAYRGTVAEAEEVTTPVSGLEGAL